MKKLNIIVLLLILLGSACKKDAVDYKTSASFNVINAVVGAGAMKVNPDVSPRFTYANASSLAFGAGAFYQTFLGSSNITIVSAADTTNTLFKGSIDLTHSVNTLYLIGQSPAIDTMYRKETNIPFIPTVTTINPDSSFYVRFVNLSPNSTPLNFKMTVSKLNVGASTSTEVTSLAYKSITGFKKYSADFKVTSSYVFEVWNTANTIKLASITLTLASTRFKTLSIIVKGIMADPPTPPIPNQLSLSQVTYF